MTESQIKTETLVFELKKNCSNILFYNMYFTIFCMIFGPV